MKYDFCIVGGGMVGSAAVLALATLGLNIAWISGPSVRPYQPSDEPDVRMSALTLGTIKFLESIGAWQAIANMRTKPYSALSVWEGDMPATTFTAQELNTDYLGHFVENRLVQLGCEHALENYANVVRISNQKVLDTSTADGVNVVLENKEVVTANWLIGADGGKSVVREAAGIGTRGWQYEQQAMGIIVELEHESGDETWQQFFSTGPRALLPMHENFAALIWYDSSERLKDLAELSDEVLLHEVVNAFSDRLPRIKRIINKAKFGLAAMHAHKYVAGRTLLVGDAAHTVNPLAGQGVNMGFGDVNALFNVLKTYNATSPYDNALLGALKRDFERKQRHKNNAMMTALDVIYSVFKVNNKGVGLLRQAGLYIANNSGPLKHAVLKRAAGL